MKGILSRKSFEEFSWENEPETVTVNPLIDEPETMMIDTVNPE